MSLRGILRGFGLKVGPTTSQSFAARINHLVDGHTSFEAVAAALLSLHAVGLREFKSLERSVRVQLRLHTGAFADIGPGLSKYRTSGDASAQETPRVRCSGSTLASVPVAAKTGACSRMALVM
jgi:hypothetical protein